MEVSVARYKLFSLGKKSVKDNSRKLTLAILLPVLADSRHATVRVGKSALSGKVIFFYFLRDCTCIPFPGGKCIIILEFNF